MKIILSRKGFDSSAGGCASPIFEDGSYFSLPILQPNPLPAEGKRISFADLDFRYPIGTVVEDLTRQKVKATETIHFDPDLRSDSLPRKLGWRGMFGQCSAAQSHLSQHSVGPGDIFLFFGWFRDVEKRNGKFEFKRGTSNRHVIFGWLEVDDIWRLGTKRTGIPNWAHMHPHITTEFSDSNTVYVASDRAGGAGTFSKVTKSLVLTAAGANRSVWRLPSWFHPNGKKSCLSYHAKEARWTMKGDCVYLSSVGRGQEFVLDCDDYPEAENWARQLIAQRFQ